MELDSYSRSPGLRAEGLATTSSSSAAAAVGERLMNWATATPANEVGEKKKGEGMNPKIIPFSMAVILSSFSSCLQATNSFIDGERETKLNFSRRRYQSGNCRSKRRRKNVDL